MTEDCGYGHALAECFRRSRHLHFRHENDERRTASRGGGKNARDIAAVFIQSFHRDSVRDRRYRGDPVVKCQHGHGHRLRQRRVAEPDSGHRHHFRREHRHYGNGSTGGV
ncbi:hypothetical protein SDC9_143848 [bioreactor metagenome]|uniref:Uncharacterized protein n=1 Tax=bioreactor metagenome TaxID=1076179 RepID=A0A645E785_9ZZZZ